MTRQRKGFVLLEVLLAVAIFAIGVITLGRCVSNCVAAERLKMEDEHARQILENRVAELQSGAIPLGKETTDILKAPFESWKLKQSSVPLDRKNETDQPLTGLLAVTLEVTWPSDGETHARSVTFYAVSRVP
jgi:type II secretion system protein I